MNAIVADSEIDVIAAVIDKVRLAQKYANPWSPYEIALHFCMETLLSRMRQLDQGGRLVHVIFESRGRREDAELELHFRRIAANQAHWGYKQPDFRFLEWEPVFIDKRSNASTIRATHGGQPASCQKFAIPGTARGMSTMNISLPDALRSFVDEQVIGRGYGTSSEYVRDLIRNDQARQRVRGLLLEGAASAATAPADRSYFDGLRERVRNRRSG